MMGDVKVETQLMKELDKVKKQERIWLSDKQIPLLKKLWKKIWVPNNVSNASYYELLDTILKELDRAYDEGYAAASSRNVGSSNSGYSMRAEQGISEGSFIITPYLGSNVGWGGYNDTR